MPVFSHSRTSRPARQPVVVEGDTYYKSDWMDSGRDPLLSPTVFLVEQSPGVSLRTHFHRENQFQLFVRGGGRLGPHAIDALTVHYAGAYTGYGPLVAGPQGLAYFTLRSVWETGSFTLKDHPDAMRRGPKRALHSAPTQAASPADLEALRAPATQDLLGVQPDSVCAVLQSLPSGHEASLSAHTGSAGCFHLLLCGWLDAGGRQLGVWDSVFTPAGEPGTAVQAGPGGAQWVSLQLPPKDRAYASAA